jgi:hypothetical protein
MKLVGRTIEQASSFDFAQDEAAMRCLASVLAGAFMLSDVEA